MNEKWAKEFESLTITDDVIFGATFEEYPELCKHLIEIILDIKVKDLHYIEREKSIDERLDAKGIRLDIYVEEQGTGRSFDIEMQIANKADLGKRMRYYQGMIDMDKLKPGDSYKKLTDSYIIFICLFDPFKRGLGKQPLIHKYLNNLIEMWPLLIMLLAGVGLVLAGIAMEVWRKPRSKGKYQGIWPAGIGTVLTVLALLLCAGWNYTAYYPSTYDTQMSLTIDNSSSSEFTLRTMFYVSLLVPLVLAYIVYCWRKIDSRKLDREELAHDDEAY